jgi:hypothetical protein
VNEDRPSRRQNWSEGPAGGPIDNEWLALPDDDLLYRITSLAPTGHGADDSLIAIVRSNRHFFIRQEAAKKVTEPSRLRELWDDRHVGQILVRGLNRADDVEYLRKLVTQSRHLDVRNAAQAQLDLIARRDSTPPPPGDPER